MHDMHDMQSCLRKLLSNELLLSMKAHPPTDLDRSDGSNYEDTAKTAELPLQLPKPSCIAQQLESAGVPSLVARNISNTYLAVATELYAACESSYQDTIKSSSHGYFTRKTVELMSHFLRNFYTQKTRDWIDAVLGLAHNAIAKPESAFAEPIQADMKPVFNYEYTPVLEKYFEYNAYPSTPDKAVLASKSNMTLRQIEVWFQNHRNRSKKEGKPLRKMTGDPLPLDLALKALEQSTAFPANTDFNPDTKSHPILMKHDASIEAPNPAVFKTSHPPHILDPPRPPHVFPEMYSSHDNSSTNRGVHSFPAPVWPRYPTTAPHIVKTSINIDELVKEFDQKLHLGTSILSRQRQQPSSKPWWTTKVTIPSPAPLPALIRLHVTSSSTYTQPLSPPAALATHPFTNSSPNSSSQAIMSTSRQEFNTSVRKKTAHLPRRIPKNASIMHPRGSPTRLSASPTSSRTSSSSSSSSSTFNFEAGLNHNRLASDSSSSSLVSSRPVTPVSQENLHPPPVIALPGLDFQHTDLFGQYGKMSDPDSEAVFTLTPDLQKYQQPPITFESLDGLLMSAY